MLSDQINPLKLQILKGIIDANSPLNLLYGQLLIWRKIWDSVILHYYSLSVNRSSVAFYEIGLGNIVPWPEFTGLSVNMMPFRLFDKQSLPDNLRKYWPIIQNLPVSYHQPAAFDRSCFYQEEYLQKCESRIAYLTIDEKILNKGESPRRPGIHIERPASIDGYILNRNTLPDVYDGLCWGLGYWNRESNIPIDGIYMANNLENSARIWPIQIDNPENITDAHGGIEKMRDLLGNGHHLRADQMYWFTDTTPHECLPSEIHDAKRQFIRIVVGKISAWYSKHNTPNPLGIQPDAPIVDSDKFASA